MLVENDSAYKIGCFGGYVPAREYSMRSRFASVVTLPTDERVLAVPRCCCNATAGGRPSMSSTSGAFICSNSRRAYGATDSR